MSITVAEASSCRMVQRERIFLRNVRVPETSNVESRAAGSHRAAAMSRTERISFAADAAINSKERSVTIVRFILSRHYTTKIQ